MIMIIKDHMISNIVAVGSLALAFVLAEPQIARAEDNDVDIGVRFDCQNDFNRDSGAAQDCFRVSGLRGRFTMARRNSRALIEVDPFSSRDPITRDLPYDVVPKDSNADFISHYALTWIPRPNLEVQFVDHSGVTGPISLTGLSSENGLFDQGWDQAAIGLRYNLAAFEGLNVELFSGNGEGETYVNSDPQQYFGFRVDATVIKGIRTVIAASFDGNNVGSSQSDAYTSFLNDNCAADFSNGAELGFSAQRILASVFLDGTWARARGLKFGVNYQSNTFADLNKNKNGFPELSKLKGCSQLHPRTILVESEDPTQSNTIENTIFGAGFSFKILDTYFVGAGLESKTVTNSAVSLFQRCDRYVDLTCAQSGRESRTLKQASTVFGFGMDLNEELELVLDYTSLSYDGAYQRFYYVKDGDKATDTFELFNVRIGYNW